MFIFQHPRSFWKYRFPLIQWRYTP